MAKFLPQHDLPKVSRDPARLPEYVGSRALGIDFEWDLRTLTPTICGVSNGDRALSSGFTELLPGLRRVIETSEEVVGHNLVAAELPILRKHGIHIADAKIADTILYHYLANAHLCKGTNKSEDEGGVKGRGFMNIWAMLSLYTDTWNYKYCRGKGCQGPCPEHEPYQYNGNDALWPVRALPGLKYHARLRGVEDLYRLHVRLADVLVGVRERGVRVNLPYVARLRKEFAAAKRGIYSEGTSGPVGTLAAKFNPESPKQVVAYFAAAHDLKLENAQEATVREAWEETENADLRLLLDWKEIGDGPERWFAARIWDEEKWVGYVDGASYVHPRLGFFTSSGRMQCTSPNLQNVAARRVDRETGENIGKKVRRAIIASPGHYLLKADLSNAENRAFMWHDRGYTLPADADIHTANASAMGLTPTDEFVIRIGGGKPRQAAKSITHGQGYLEGIQLRRPSDLLKPGVAREVAAGARIVYPDWKFDGSVVTFTGVNLARRVYGKASLANRAKVNGLIARYFAAFPSIRAVQRAITREVEANHAIRTPSGHYCILMGTGEEKLKTAASIMGSEPVAYITKVAILRAAADGRLRVVLQVHDELVFEVPRNIHPRIAARWVRDYLETPTEQMPGLSIPCEVSVGENWGNTKTIYKEGRWLL